MSMQFEHVLTGEGIRRGKMQQDAGIDGAAIGGPEVAERGNARCGSPAAKGHGKFAEICAGDADDTNAGATGSGRDGGNGIPAGLRPCCRWRLFRHFRSSG
jgi:hypothetical protein